MSAQTAAWVEAQNKVTFPYLEKIPYRQQLRARVNALNDTRSTRRRRARGRTTSSARTTARRTRASSTSRRGSTARRRSCSIPTSSRGRRRRGWARSRRRPTRSTPSTASRRPDPTGSNTRSWSWRRRRRSPTRSSGSRSRASPGTATASTTAATPRRRRGKEKAAINEDHRVYFHKVGTPQSQDRQIYQDAANAQRFHIVQTTDDERFALLTVSDRGKGKDGNALFARDLSRGDARVQPGRAHIGNESYGVVDNLGDKLLVETNRNAPNGRVVLVDPAKPDEANWKVVLPEQPEPLQSVSSAGGKLFATYLKDVTTRAYVYSLDGTLENEDRAARARQRRRVRRQQGRHVRVLHVQLAQRSADDLPLRHRDEEEHGLPPAEGAGLQPGRCTRPRRCSTRARTARRSRCSSCTRRA